jgi:Histidine kinase-, DNA gyrase B-, and HSP90-like ATPase
MPRAIRTSPQNKGKPVPQPLIGSFLLESITTGMYGERKNAIREYVQNSFDGIQAAIEARGLLSGAGKVSLTLSPDKKTLVIYDNGIGLPHRIAVNTLTAVGASRKERGRQAGFRGIGRLAGIAFTKTLRFRTKAAGDDLETIVEFDCEALRTGMLNTGRKPAAELISACATFDQTRATDTNAHYFEVSLIGLRNAPAETTDPLHMKAFLSQVAPVDFHPEFRAFRTQIFEKAETLQIRPLPENDEDNKDASHAEDTALDEDKADWSILEDNASSMLDRIPVSHIAMVIRSGDPIKEEQIYKPYRPRLGVDDSNDVALTSVSLHHGESGAWWGWIGHKAKPGEYQDDAVSGIRFRLKNIQIDGNDLITLVPTKNQIRDPFTRWSNWFLGEIYIDPRAVVPNARRDNFEEDARWLKIREEISEICGDLTAEARRVSKEHQTSLEMIDKKIEKLRADYLSIIRATTFNTSKAQKILIDSDKLHKDIEKASNGAPSAEQLRLKSMAKELTQIRVALLEKPKTPEYERFRAAIRREFLDKTLVVLNEYLDIGLFEEVKQALDERLR